MLFDSKLGLNGGKKLSGEEYYSNPNFWKPEVLSEHKIQFRNETLRVLQAKGIDCSGKHVADVGCGTGHLLLNISKVYRPASMTGLEIVEAAMVIAKTTVPQARIYYCDLYQPIIKHKFDVVFCTEVLEHILSPEKALRNLIGMTNIPGVVIITVPNGRTDRCARHFNFWSPESWEVFVNDVCSGYNVETGLIMKSKYNYAVVRLE
jgi:2-polyprenyl-3-methyl-5-hydroxy-6-metoxy-1,4-benzoquinol methylase